MRCPEEGCQAVFPARSLKRHLAKECLVARRRRALVEQGLRRKEAQREEERLAAIAAVAAAVEAKQRAKERAQSASPSRDGDGADSEWWGRGTRESAGVHTIVVCEKCGEGVKPSGINEHNISGCLYRTVYCPNRPLGCRVELPFADLQKHLEEQCEVERKKDLLIERAENRDFFICPGCGAEVAAIQYRKHQRSQCPNRKVHCKNHYLGCRVMLRPSMRAIHEIVSDDAHQRSCLYLGGQGTHISLVSSRDLYIYN
jgi:hypothetical protein